MSRRKDRERAKSGLVFRNSAGFSGLVNREEWEAEHPTKTQQREALDKFLREEMAKKRAEREALDFKDQSAVAAEAIPNRYYCTACRKHHIKTSKIGSEHLNFYLED